MYGENYTPEDSATVYAGCLKTCGFLPKCLCFVCATCKCGPVRQIEQGRIGILTEFGRIVAKLGPGLHSFNPLTQKIIKVDMRVQSVMIPPQILLTKDNCTVIVDVFINYKIVVPEYTLYFAKNYFTLLTKMVQSVMRIIFSERTLSQLLNNRKEIEKSTTHIVDEKAHPYGIDVVSIETQRMELPKALERAMAIAAESEKEAEAKQIKARGNFESAKIFTKAANELGKNQHAMELKYFEFMKEIAAEGPSTTIVPNSYLGVMQDRIDDHSLVLAASKDYHRVPEEASHGGPSHEHHYHGKSKSKSPKKHN